MANLFYCDDIKFLLLSDRYSVGHAQLEIARVKECINSKVMHSFFKVIGKRVKNKSRWNFCKM